MDSRNDLQWNIRGWWEGNPMTYDWRKTLSYEEGTPEFFQAVDDRFWKAAWFAHTPNEQPFNRLIDYQNLEGKRVLEIGCGSGAITAQLAKSGALLTAIDLTSRAVALTRRRFELLNVSAEVQQMDAEHLEYPEETFDFVWSWGVIHHSANTAAIVAEIHRVLKPGGEARIMVYHRSSMNYWIHLMFIRGLLCGGLFRYSIQELSNKYTDGLIANYYTSDQMKAMWGKHFPQVQTAVYGQKNELWQVSAGRVKDFLVKATPNGLAEWLTRKFGGFLFVQAIKESDAPG